MLARTKHVSSSTAMSRGRSQAPFASSGAYIFETSPVAFAEPSPNKAYPDPSGPRQLGSSVHDQSATTHPVSSPTHGLAASSAADHRQQGTNGSEQAKISPDLFSPLQPDSPTLHSPKSPKSPNSFAAGLGKWWFGHRRSTSSSSISTAAADAGRSRHSPAVSVTASSPARSNNPFFPSTLDKGTLNSSPGKASNTPQIKLAPSSPDPSMVAPSTHQTKKEADSAPHSELAGSQSKPSLIIDTSRSNTPAVPSTLSPASTVTPQQTPQRPNPSSMVQPITPTRPPRRKPLRSNTTTPIKNESNSTVSPIKATLATTSPPQLATSSTGQLAPPDNQVASLGPPVPPSPIPGKSPSTHTKSQSSASIKNQSSSHRSSKKKKGSTKVTADRVPPKDTKDGTIVLPGGKTATRLPKKDTRP